jgi:putative ABC transport system permease protein
MGIIINETAEKLLGYADPLGKKLNTWSDPPEVFRVIGVVKDLCYESKHQKVMPMGIVNIRGPFGLQPGSVAVRIKSGDYREMIAGFEKIWDTYSPAVPFKYSFFDKDYENLYSNEMQTRKLFLAFSFLAVFIACLGLLGLASFLAQQKTKEIGIRKAFGATTLSISLLFTKGFTQWVILANLIAWPVAWYFFDNWLNNFAYRTGIPWWYFALAGIVSLAIALVTVSYQTIRAAKGKPIEALRYE